MKSKTMQKYFKSNSRDVYVHILCSSLKMEADGFDINFLLKVEAFWYTEMFS